MAEYIEIDEARERSGLRLVLTAGVPGPFGESARYLFELKGVPFARVRQTPVVSDAALREWTAQTSAPVAVLDDERPRSSWVEILYLAERLGTEPRLIPRDPAERVQMFGLSHEICGDQGYGWERRLMLIHDALRANADPGGVLAHIGSKYGYTPEAGASAGARAGDILELLSTTLRAQRERGSRFFVGDALSAADVFWAAFSQMLDPLPDDLAPMPAGLRSGYTLQDESVRKAADPILLEHRDFIFQTFIGLPLDY